MSSNVEKLEKSEEKCEEESEERNEENNEETDFSSPEMQKARAFLRERFLRVISGIIGKTAEFQSYENSYVSGEFRGSDVECSEMYVRNLHTPMGVIPEAILRTNDVISMNVNNIEINE